MFVVRMSYECPHCKHPLIRKGRWFYVSGHYMCEACDQEVLITHDDKLRLLRKYASKNDQSRLRETKSPAKS